MPRRERKPHAAGAATERATSSTGSISFIPWILALFGTAVGAGVLFLPNQAGQGGFWVLGAAALMLWPTIVLGHRLYALIPNRVGGGVDFSAAVAHRLPRGDLVAPLGAIFLLLVPAGIVLSAADLRAERGLAAWFSVASGVVVIGAYFIGKGLGGA